MAWRAYSIMKILRLFFSLVFFLVFISQVLAQHENSFASSPVGQFVFKIDKTKTKLVYSMDEATKLLDLPGPQDILVALISNQDIVYIRFIKLLDGRLVRINSTPHNANFYFMVDYWDGKKKDEKSLVECWVLKTGKITELCNNYAIDPHGKTGIVFTPEFMNSVNELKKQGGSVKLGGYVLLSEKDSVVVRYQTEINKLLKILM